MKIPRTIDLPAELLPLRVRIRWPTADKPGTIAYLELDVSATGYTCGVTRERTCSSERCCGRPKAPVSTPDPQEAFRV